MALFLIRIAIATKITRKVNPYIGSWNVCVVSTQFLWAVGISITYDRFDCGLINAPPLLKNYFLDHIGRFWLVNSLTVGLFVPVLPILRSDLVRFLFNTRLWLWKLFFNSFFFNI